MNKKRIVTHRQLARHNGWHNEYCDPKIDTDPVDVIAWCIIVVCVIAFIFIV